MRTFRIYAPGISTPETVKAESVRVTPSGHIQLIDGESQVVAVIVPAPGWRVIDEAARGE